jgi:hypothetical protein
LLELNQLNVKTAQLFFILFGFERCIFNDINNDTGFLFLLTIIVILLLSGRGIKGRTLKCKRPELMD